MIRLPLTSKTCEESLYYTNDAHAQHFGLGFDIILCHISFHLERRKVNKNNAYFLSLCLFKATLRSMCRYTVTVDCQGSNIAKTEFHFLRVLLKRNKA